MALSEPVAPGTLWVSLNETNRMIHMVWIYWACHECDNETSQLDIELTNFTYFITFIWTGFDKIQVNHQEEDTKKYELIRRIPSHPRSGLKLMIRIKWPRWSTISWTMPSVLTWWWKEKSKWGWKRRIPSWLFPFQMRGLGMKRLLHTFLIAFTEVDKARSRAQGGTGLEA